MDARIGFGVLVVVIFVAIAAVARRGGAAAVLRLGVGMMVVGLAVAAAGAAALASCRAAGGAALAARRAKGGAPAAGPPAPPAPPASPALHPYGNGQFTAAEIRAIRAVRGRLLPEPPADTAALPRLPYRQHVYPPGGRTTRHFGQRKLLLSEVEFLSRRLRPGDTVVYVGAAPGIHVPFLAALFQRERPRFELYDPREFRMREPGNIPKQLPSWNPAGSDATPQVQDRHQTLKTIATHREFFTEATARQYAGRDDVLLVSDIRTGTDGPELPSDATVAADMAEQERWVFAMEPRAILLKYRLNYTRAEPVPYIEGRVCLQAWTGTHSTEARLEAARPYRRAPADARAHEERMFYLNTVLREWGRYDHGVPLGDVPGLDAGFDSATEARIWREYLASRGEAAAPETVAALMLQASAAIGRGLEPTR